MDLEELGAKRLDKERADCLLFRRRLVTLTSSSLSTIGWTRSMDGMEKERNKDRTEGRTGNSCIILADIWRNKGMPWSSPESHPKQLTPPSERPDAAGVCLRRRRGSLP